MSQFVPDNIETADINMAQKPYFGGEFAAYLTAVQEVHIGDIDFTAEDTMAFTDDNTTSLPSSGADLQVVTTSQLRSDDPTVITFVGTDQDDALLTGVATFAPPSWVHNQSNNFPLGYAVDVVPNVSGKKFKTITSASATGGSRSASLAVFVLPALSDFALVACSTEKDFTTKSRPSKPIACGMDGSRFNKAGRSEPGTLTLNAKLRTMGDGLARFDGVTCTAMLVGIAEDLVLKERLVFTQYVPKLRPRIPDGDNEAVLECEGNYQQPMYFIAG